MIQALENSSFEIPSENKRTDMIDSTDTIDARHLQNYFSKNLHTFENYCEN